MARPSGLGNFGRDRFRDQVTNPTPASALPATTLPSTAQTKANPKFQRNLGGGLDPDDFAPYFVTPVEEYYQGPTASSRLVGHQFIPMEEISSFYEEPESVVPESFGRGMAKAPGTESPLGRQFDAHLIYGYIYVRWKRAGRNRSGLWRYGPVTLDIYRQFRDSGSKGQFVRNLEIYGHGEAPVSPPNLGI